MRQMWRSKSFLTALSFKACLGTEAVALVVFTASCLKSVFASSCFRSDVGHQGDMAYLPVTVYRGLGGCHICIMDCRTLTDVLAAVDARTDWLWGVGHSYVVVDMDSSELLGWEHIFPFCTADFSLHWGHQVQIIYLPYRITNQGFCCRSCYGFVFWDTIWYTRYDESARIDYNYERSLRNPRSFYCFSCGNSCPDHIARCLELVRVSVRSSSFSSGLLASAERTDLTLGV